MKPCIRHNGPVKIFRVNIANSDIASYRHTCTHIDEIHMGLWQINRYHWTIRSFLHEYLVIITIHKLQMIRTRAILHLTLYIAVTQFTVGKLRHCYVKS